MSPPDRRCSETGPRLLAVLAFVLLPACSSIGDFGRLQNEVVTDDIHSWVGKEAAIRAHAPISADNLTADEHALCDLAFPLIEPTYDRIRWDAVLYEYGTKREFQRELFTTDVAAYYRNLQAAGFRSSAGKYNRIIDDIRNDAVRIGPFFDLARRVRDMDQRREASMAALPDIGPPQRASARARIGENSLTIVWVHRSLTQRFASYRYALDHLVVAEPERLAVTADVALKELQQFIAANEVVPLPRLAAVPGGAVVPVAPISK